MQPYEKIPRRTPSEVAVSALAPERAPSTDFSLSATPFHFFSPSSPWSPRRRPSEEAQLCLHQEQLISQSGLPQCVCLSFAGREEEQLCLQHCPWTTTQPGRGQRLAGGDNKHSQPNAELAKGRQVRMPCAPVDLTPWMDLERHRVALLNKNSRHGSRCALNARMR